MAKAKPEHLTELRRRAEAELPVSDRDVSGLSLEETRTLVHELQVHQRELEIQNDELRRAQHELSQSADRLANLYHRAPVGYLIVDPNGTVLDVNATLSEMLGVERQQIMSKGLAELAKGDSRRELLGRMRAWLRKPEDKRLDLTMEGAGTTVIDVELTARHELPEDPSRVLVGVVDVTEQRATMAALERSREEWSLTVDASPDMISVVSPDYRLLRVNRACCERLQATAAELIGRRCFEVFGEDDICTGCPHNEAFETGTPRTGRVLFSKLDEIHNICCAPYVNSDGVIEGTVHVSHDLTPILNEQEQRLQLEKQLHQKQKLESIGVLAGGVAHDFNNILQTISGRAELAAEDTNEPAVAASLDAIVASAKHAAGICRQMLTFAGQQSGRPVMLQLAKVIDGIAELLRASVDENVLLNLHPSPELPAVEADPTLLRQVVLNLVINAAEACGSEPGRVDVRVERIERVDIDEAAWSGVAELRGECVRLRVSDDGAGMAPDVVKLVFDPFYSTKITGRGLGLATVLGIVKALGGAIGIDSEPGRGTTFVVDLPAAQPTVRPGANGRSRADNPASSRLVLVADDEDAVRLVLRRGLENNGLELVTADGGRAAIDLLEQRGDEIGAAVVDVGMPDLDGLEVLKAIRAQWPEMPVVLASGHAEAETRDDRKDDANCYFMQKPFKIAEMRALLEKLLQPS